MTRQTPTEGTTGEASRSTTGRKVRYADRLLAEALRWYETLHGPLRIDTAGEHRIAITSRGETAGDHEGRLVARARATEVTTGLERALIGVRTLIGWLILAGLVAGFLLGATTARASLSEVDEARVNFYWALGSLLGVQTVALLIWLILLAASLVHQWRTRHRGAGDGEPLAGFSLGSVLVALARWIATRAKHDSVNVAAVQAVMQSFSRGRIGRWSLSAISHSLWLAFNVGALVMVVLLLSARQYTFVWETTILSEREYRQLTHAIGVLPNKAGFLVPTDAQIASSQWTGRVVSEQVGAPEAWSGLLVGCLVLYGFAPRLILVGLSLSLRRQARGAFRLDLDDPYYAALRARLTPPAPTLSASTLTGGDGEPAAAEPDRPSIPAPQRPPGPPAIVGLEMPRPLSGWPPALHGVVWQDLGLIETRDDRERVLRQLREDPTQPGMLVLTTDLTVTPDRGLQSLGAQLTGTVRSPTVLLLSGGQKLRQRAAASHAIAERVQDWRRLGERLGLPADHVIELDLDHLTDHGRRQLAALLDNQPGQPTPIHERRIESAFDQIATSADDWSVTDSPPTPERQAKLHRSIAQLYDASAASLAATFALPTMPTNLDQMRDAVTIGARGMLNLMPDRLRRTGRWMTAGALAGGIGCVAAAMTLSPAAIGSLPLWSAVGGVVSGLLAEMREHRGASNDQATVATEAPDLGDAVRAAALFALVLELQGRGEVTISRVLDRTLPGGDDADDETAMRRGQDIRLWLASVRHRFDLALAQEAAA